MAFAFCDFKSIRRAMSRTPSKLARLTRNGLVFDHVHYRWNRAAVEDVLDAGDRRLPAGLRTPGTAMVLVSIRVWDDDVDMIEVFDPATGTYHEMWSTEPEYTSGLSRWEHHEYLRMVRAGKGGAMSETDRLLAKGLNLEEAEREMPELSFRDRAVGAALTEAEGYRRASGARARRPGYADVPELGLTMTAGGEGRVDRPTTPPQPGRRGTGAAGAGKKARKGRRTAASRRPPERGPDYGRASTPREPTDGRTPDQGPAADGAASAAEARAARIARWAALAGRDEPTDDDGSSEGGEYHLRQDEERDGDETGDGVSYDDEESEDRT